MLEWNSVHEALEFLGRECACHSTSYSSAAAGQITVILGTLDNTNSSHCFGVQNLDYLGWSFCSVLHKAKGKVLASWALTERFWEEAASEILREFSSWSPQDWSAISLICVLLKMVFLSSCILFLLPFSFEIRYQTAHTALKFEREPGITLILFFSFYLPNAKLVGIYHHTQLIVLRFEPRDFCMPFKHSANWVTSATLHSPAWKEKRTLFWFLILIHLLSFTRGSSLFLRVYVILWLDLNWLKLDSPRHSITSGS